MKSSVSIAKVIGPTLIFMVSSELEIWNPTLYDSQIIPLVYLSGVLMFVAGIAIISKHNLWSWRWETVITIIGFLAIILGILRMFFPQTYNRNFNNGNITMYIQIILIAIGFFLTYKGYSQKS